MLTFKQFLIERKRSKEANVQDVGRTKKKKAIAEAVRTADRALQVLGRIERNPKNHTTGMIGLDTLKSFIKKTPEHIEQEFRKYPPYKRLMKKKLQRATVPINKVYSRQRFVIGGAVKHKLNGDPLNSTERPTMIYHKATDTYHIHDGNHRANAARLRGDRTIDADVLFE